MKISQENGGQETQKVLLEQNARHQQENQRLTSQFNEQLQAQAASFQQIRERLEANLRTQNERVGSLHKKETTLFK